MLLKISMEFVGTRIIHFENYNMYIVFVNDIWKIMEFMVSMLYTDFAYIFFF